MLIFIHIKLTCINIFISSIIICNICKYIEIRIYQLFSDNMGELETSETDAMQHFASSARAGRRNALPVIEVHLTRILFGLYIKHILSSSQIWKICPRILLEKLDQIFKWVDLLKNENINFCTLCAPILNIQIVYFCLKT